MNEVECQQQNLQKAHKLMETEQPADPQTGSKKKSRRKYLLRLFMDIIIPKHRG